ncbi:hypothetical protein L2E82_21468 [Cichorium intybus]|uniref:Uncharacterized protein n=1 Tax=Cichorium intybus TaxID=13427 RepID=A0ACB9DW81_CICIN|nr:hypothetical protein L2E82_21468 [Cichorium intybus]
MTADTCEVEIESGKFFSGDSSCEILGGSMEVIGDKPDDKGFKNGGRIVEVFGLETTCIVVGSATTANIHQDNDEFTIENSESVEVDVELQALHKKNVEHNSSLYDDATESANESLKITYDGKKSQMAVMENVEDTSNITKSINDAEQPLKTDTELTFGANNNNREIIVENISADKVTHEGVKDMDDVISMVSSEFIDTRIEDTNSRVHELEDMIEHEPLCLKDEKQFIYELEPLNNYCDQLVSNVGSQNEVQQAINQQNKIEEPLENLRNELNSLKDIVSKDEVTTLTIRNTLVEENEKREQVQAVDETKSILVVSTVEQGKKAVPENKHTGYQTMKKVARRINCSMKTTKPVKFQIRDSIFACLNEIIEDEEKDKNVVEFDRKENVECKLKEHKRLEEKKKPKEAKENKKQKAKKAQKQAGLLAQKEKEKRLNQKPQGPLQVAAAVKRKRRCHQLGKMGMVAVFISILLFLCNIIYVQ